METNYEVRPGHLLVSASGPYDAQQARAALGEAIQRCVAAGVSRMLVDCRGITTIVSIADRHALAMQIASIGRGALRVAIVVANENFFTKTLEDTASNRGAHVRTTDSLEAAIAYLELAP